MNLESANLFAALDTKKKKKSKSSKDHDKKKKPDKAEKAAELDKAIFSQPAPTTTNWADDDEFDDDFENDLGPLPESWAQVGNCSVQPRLLGISCVQTWHNIWHTGSKQPARGC